MLQEAQAGRFLSPAQILLTTLIVKIAVMAVLATMVARYRRFRHILIFERRGWLDRLVFMLAIGLPLTAGVAFRVLLHYDAADLTLEGAFLAGLIAGPYTGGLVGLLVATPALIAGQFIALPFAVGCGFAGGGLREAAPKEAIWQFTPFVFIDLHKHVWRMLRKFEPNWQVILLLAPVALELLRQALGTRFGEERLFFLGAPTRPWMTVLVLLATVLCVATPIKIWNSARIEHRLQEQEHLLLAAKIEALKSQINPHFLFNTLTSISSLIRSEPDTARMLIIKLSALLRRLMRSHQHFVSLREELDAIDEYLAIEVVRFGPKLTVRKEIDPGTMEVIVPSMILQPLVENSIKHGLSRKLGAGTITIRSHRDSASTAPAGGTSAPLATSASTTLGAGPATPLGTGSRVVIEVEDDGMGFVLDRLNQPMSSGIGLANVRERLRVIYGASYQLRLESEPGQGTRAQIEVPEMLATEQITA